MYLFFIVDSIDGTVIRASETYETALSWCFDIDGNRRVNYRIYRVKASEMMGGRSLR